MEKLEVIGPWSGTEGDSVDPKGEVGRRSDRTKAAREEKERLKEDEMEVDGDAPQGKRAEIQPPERTVIRVESEETQVYVCGMLAIGQEEAEELAIVPSALSEPRGPIHWCDNRCSEKAVRYWQFASVVVEEGGEAHTINLCQQCCNERRVQQGEPRPNSWQWRAVVEKEAHRGIMWIFFGNEPFLRGVWEFSPLKRAEAKNMLEDAAWERQERIQGQWHQESSEET